MIGRGGDVAVRLEDPDVSRRHAAVEVGSGSITVADLSSTNGSRLDDVALDGHPRPWPTGAVLRLGASALTVGGPAGTPAPVEAASAGRLRVRPVPRLSVPAAETEIVFPRPPAPPSRRRLAWVAVALPAIGGVVMAVLLHTPTFLFFALLSPVVALGTWLSERWTGRRSGRRDAAAHAAEVVAAEARLGDAVTADVRATEAALPDLAALAGAARRRTHLLWSRASGDADALCVRVGRGPGATRVVRVLADGSRAPATALDQPVAVDLRSGGGLAVIGPRERARGVLSAVIAQIAVLHAPGSGAAGPAHRGRPSARLGLGPLAAPSGARCGARPATRRPAGRRRGPQRRPDPAGDAAARGRGPSGRRSRQPAPAWQVAGRPRRPFAGGTVHRHAEGRPGRRGAGALRSEHRRGRPRAGRRGPAAGRRDGRRGGAVLRRTARSPERPGGSAARPHGERTRT